MAQKVTNYKGWTITSSGASLGFFSSGRAGKVVRKYWVEKPGGFGVFGKWVGSVAEGKKFINEQERK